MPKKQTAADRHKSGLMVRFPEEYRQLFEELKSILGQSYTTAAQRAMKAYHESHVRAKK